MFLIFSANISVLSDTNIVLMFACDYVFFCLPPKKYLMVRSKKFSFPTCAWNPSGIYPVYIVNLSCYSSFWQADFVGGSFFYCHLLPYMVKRGDSLFTWLKLLWMTAVLYRLHFNLHWNPYLIYTLAAIFFKGSTKEHRTYFKVIIYVNSPVQKNAMK